MYVQKQRKGQETKDCNDTLYCNVWQCMYKKKGKDKKQRTLMIHYTVMYGNVRTKTKEN